MKRAGLWIRAALFTLFVPGVVCVLAPWLIDGRRPFAGVLGVPGALMVGLGVLAYALTLSRFVAAGGTPMIFFMRSARVVVGEEPPVVVDGGLYAHSRNPMYVAALLVVFGQAIMRASWNIAAYGVALAFFYHLNIVYLEEPHLRRQRGPAYDAYYARVPRWF